MKVAFATTNGVSVDEHFGRAGTFAVYELTADGYRFVEMRQFAQGTDEAVVASRGQAGLHEDRVELKVERLADCKVIYLTEIGGPSAARLIRRGMMPIRVKAVVTIEESLRNLLATVQASPPPWLRKAITGD